MNETNKISLNSDLESSYQKNLLTLYKQSFLNNSFQNYFNFHNRSHTSIENNKKKIPNKIFQITQNNNYRLPHYINLNNDIFYNTILKIPPEKRIFFTEQNEISNNKNFFINKNKKIKDNYLIKINDQNKTEINLNDRHKKED